MTEPACTTEQETTGKTSEVTDTSSTQESTIPAVTPAQTRGGEKSQFIASKPACLQ